MSSFVRQLGEYSLECEYAFTFFPTNSGAALKTPKIRAGRLTPSWKELLVDDLYTHANNYAIGQGGDEGESLTVGQAVRAYISITLNRRNIFEADLSVYVGQKDSKGVTKSFKLPADVRIPFMIIAGHRAGMRKQGMPRPFSRACLRLVQLTVKRSSPCRYCDAIVEHLRSAIPDQSEKG